MSNERIIEILGKNGFGALIMKSWSRSIYEGVMRSMEQYGKEQYSEGYNAAYIEDARIRSLVQAQKELIEYITGAWNDPIKYAMTREALEQKIKSLEK